MIRATLYDGDDGAAAWVLDDIRDDGSEPVRIASGAELSRAAAKSAAEDVAMRIGSPIDRWTE